MLGTRISNSSRFLGSFFSRDKKGVNSFLNIINLKLETPITPFMSNKQC